MGQAATGNEFEVAGETKDRETVVIGPDDVGELPIDAPEQTPDSPGKDENQDGLTGGQTTADVKGDILGV